jgi:hypothetical protein
MIDDVSMTWFRLRERRASLRSRSRLADSAGRRQTFAAAMQQFEEQFAAAKVVTAYTRPLNLYYGLAQAGMAIAAAHAPDPWSFSRHGLTLTDRSGEVATMMVKPGPAAARPPRSRLSTEVHEGGHDSLDLSRPCPAGVLWIPSGSRLTA